MTSPLDPPRKPAISPIDAWIPRHRKSGQALAVRARSGRLVRARVSAALERASGADRIRAAAGGLRRLVPAREPRNREREPAYAAPRGVRRARARAHAGASRFA